MGGGGGMGGGRGMGMSGGGNMGLGMGQRPQAGFMGFGAMHGAGESFHINQRTDTPTNQRPDPSYRQERPAQARTGALASERKAAALVRTEKCAGCGICIDVCPVGALRIEQYAVVNPALCTACAACVSECPNEAIIITQQRVSS